MNLEKNSYPTVPLAHGTAFATIAARSVKSSNPGFVLTSPWRVVERARPFRAWSVIGCP